MEEFLSVKNRNVLSLISAGKPDPPTACGWQEWGDYDTLPWGFLFKYCIYSRT